jgi:hypothetical protein
MIVPVLNKTKQIFLFIEYVSSDIMRRTCISVQISLGRIPKLKFFQEFII